MSQRALPGSDVEVELEMTVTVAFLQFVVDYVRQGFCCTLQASRPPAGQSHQQRTNTYCKPIVFSGSKICSLGGHSDIGQPELPFVQHLHQFNTRDDAARIVERLESLHRLHPRLDPAMILLHDVVQVLTTADFYRVFPAVIELVPHSHAP